ncbi:MAG: hypothetical protein AAGB31_14890, partial [Bdellovibrio sp.]
MMRSWWILIFSWLCTWSLEGHAYPLGKIANLKCEAYKYEDSEYSLSPLNPQAQVVGGIELPANKQVLYRGTYESNPQFGLDTALRGLFYEDYWYLGSPLFWGITEILKKNWSMDRAFLPSGGLPFKISDYLESRNILKDAQTLLDCSPKNGFSPEMAGRLAADLMNKSFKRTQKDRLQNDFFNIEN